MVTLCIFFMMGLLGIIHVSADFKVKATAKGGTVTVTGFNPKNGEDSIDFNKGDVIILKGIDSSMSKNLVIDTIKIKDITTTGLFGLWSNPILESSKGRSGKIEGKDSLSTHLNTDKRGVFYQSQRNLFPQRDVHGHWRWIEKKGGNKRIFAAAELPGGIQWHDLAGHKPGAGNIGQIPNELKGVFLTYSQARQQYQDVLDEFGLDDEDKEYERQSIAGFDIRLMVFAVVLTLCVIGICFCGFCGFIGFSLGYYYHQSMQTKEKKYYTLQSV